jgi:hypothetical protein
MLRVLLLVATLALAGEAPACQLTIPAPLAALDDSLFVLTGTVREIVGPVVSSDVTGQAFGLRVAVTENLHSPTGPASPTVDVFEYNLGGACDAIGISRADLEHRLPPGTAVRIIARAARKVPAAGSGAPPRLEAGPYNAHALLAPIYREDPVSASLSRTYDFATPIDINRYEKLDAARFDWFWYRGVVEFEAMKELLRLERARDDAQRTAILRRARRIPGIRSLDFAGLVRTYVREPGVAAALSRELQ